MRAGDAPESLPDGRMAHIQRVLGHTVRRGNGGDTPAERGGCIASPGIGQTGADDVRGRRHRLKVAPDAPGLNVSKIGFVGSER